MKQLSGPKQKWVLSLALLAVLGTQSYFQVSSNTLNSIELASRDPAADANAAQAPAKPATANKPAEAPAQPAAAAAAPAPSTTPEGTVPALCKSCLEEALQKVDANTKEIKSLKEELAKYKHKADDEDEKPKKVSKKDKDLEDEIVLDADAPEDETKAERKARKAKNAKIKVEIEKKKLAEEKKEKQETVNKEFEEKMAGIEETCSDKNLQCFGQATVDIFKEYSGKDKDMVKPENKVMIKAFNKYFGENLRASASNSLADPDLDATIRLISAEMPAEYRAYKEKSLEIVKTTTFAQAQAIDMKFKTAQMLQQANRKIEASNLKFEAGQQSNQLLFESQELVNNVIWGSQDSNDSAATIKYLKSAYLPNVNKLIKSLLDTSSNSLIGQNNANNNFGNTRSNGRGGNSTSNLLQDNANSNFGNTNNNNGINNMNNNNNNGVQFGNTTTTPQLRRVGIGI